MIFQFIFCLWNEEGIILINRKAVEHQLRVCNALAATSNLLIKDKWLNERQLQIHNKEIRALLNLLVFHLTTALIDKAVNNSVVFRCCLQVTQVDSFHETRFSIQQRLLAELLNNGDDLTVERPVSIITQFDVSILLYLLLLNRYLLN